jgi:large conductance mechanosensitive channel
MLKEFRDFISRGNVLDLAVGVIIGGAFGKIVASLVNDILMPIIGLLLGGLSFADRFVALDGQAYATLQAAKDAGAATLSYGLFIQTVMDFLIIAFVIFMIVRAANRVMKKPASPPAAPTTKDCPYCFTSIALKATRCPHCTSELKA